jgi:hypothetical protein
LAAYGRAASSISSLCLCGALHEQGQKCLCGLCASHRLCIIKLYLDISYLAVCWLLSVLHAGSNVVCCIVHQQVQLRGRGREGRQEAVAPVCLQCCFWQLQHSCMASWTACVLQERQRDCLVAVGMYGCGCGWVGASSHRQCTCARCRVRLLHSCARRLLHSCAGLCIMGVSVCAAQQAPPTRQRAGNPSLVPALLNTACVSAPQKEKEA